MDLLDSFLSRLKLLNVTFSPTGEYGDDEQIYVEDLKDANCVSSEIKASQDGKHILLLDLDVPHYYVPSSTPGHGHLYIDVPLSKPNYMLVMYMLQYFGIIQPGYFNQLSYKGHNALRLPWIKKGGGPD